MLFEINESNSSWNCDQESLRIELRSPDNKPSKFNLLKLKRPRFFLRRQGLWLLNTQGGWAPIRHRWAQWDDLAYHLRNVVEKGGGLTYASAGDAIAAVKDHIW
jgi:hypothetical protein